MGDIHVYMHVQYDIQICLFIQMHVHIHTLLAWLTSAPTELLSDRLSHSFLAIPRKPPWQALSRAELPS